MLGLLFTPLSLSSGSLAFSTCWCRFLVRLPQVQSGYMKDKQMAARPVLHMSAAVDLRGATVFEAKALVERIQALLRDPGLIDKHDEARRTGKPVA